MKPVSGIFGIALLVMAMAIVPPSFGQTVTAVPKLDFNRFTGTWYEIARYPNKREKECVSDAFMQIALADKPNRFQLVIACKIKSADGTMDAHNGNGKMQDKSGDGKLKVSFLWPFSTKYWVLALGPDNEWALVGSPNHKNLWIFSRTPTLKPEILTGIEAKAATEGFPTAKLAMTPQHVTSNKTIDNANLHK